MKKILTLALLMTLASCASTYGPYKWGSGYQDKKISDNVYEVTFIGNRYTDKKLIGDFFMRRCSEITVQNNYDFFKLLNENVKTVETKGGFDNMVFDQNISGEFVVGSDTYEYSAESFTHTGKIKLFKKSNAPKDAVDARSIIKQQDEIVAKKKAEEEKKEAEKDPWSNY